MVPAGDEAIRLFPALCRGDSAAGFHDGRYRQSGKVRTGIAAVSFIMEDLLSIISIGFGPVGQISTGQLRDIEQAVFPSP